MPVENTIDREWNNTANWNDNDIIETKAFYDAKSVMYNMAVLYFYKLDAFMSEEYTSWIRKVLNKTF